MCNSVGPITGSGISPTAAVNISGSVLAGQTALGTNQATAFAITANYTEFTTVAASTGCILPSTAQVGDQYFIASEGAQTLSVYPDVGSSINAIAANSAYSLATAKTAIFTKLTSTKWYSLFTA